MGAAEAMDVDVDVDGGTPDDDDVDTSPSTTAQGAKGLVTLDRGTAIKVTPLYGVQGTSVLEACATSSYGPHRQDGIGVSRRLRPGSDLSLSRCAPCCARRDATHPNVSPRGNPKQRDFVWQKPKINQK